MLVIQLIYGREDLEFSAFAVYFPEICAEAEAYTFLP